MPGPDCGGRVLMGMAVKYGVGSSWFNKISENEGNESEFATNHACDETDPSAYLPLLPGLITHIIYVDADEPQPGNGMLRHRRRDRQFEWCLWRRPAPPRLLLSQNQQQHAPHPGSSLGLSSACVRRVASKQGEYAAEYGPRTMKEAPKPFPQPHQLPSPTHVSGAHMHPDAPSVRLGHCPLLRAQFPAHHILTHSGQSKPRQTVSVRVKCFVITVTGTWTKASFAIGSQSEDVLDCIENK
ncbi:hypothetical protein F4604DRAFT_1937113 [Suillus subluteus]|nr:hypothetical protein F4604DRAFT_1937113 [Suillus subluteus]